MRHAGWRRSALLSGDGWEAGLARSGRSRRQMVESKPDKEWKV